MTAPVLASQTQIARSAPAAASILPSGLKAALHILALLQFSKARMWSAAFSPDGKMLAAAGAERAIWVWDASTGAVIRDLRGHDGPINHVVFHPDSRHLATASDDRTIRLWDIAVFGKEK